MDRGPLHLVEGERGPVLDRFRELIVGPKTPNTKLITQTTQSIDGLLTSEEFSHLVSQVLTPFQHLVAVALRIKEMEKEETAGITDRESLLGVKRDPVAMAVFQREYDHDLRKKWGVSLDDGSPAQLRRMSSVIMNDLYRKITGMISKINALPEREDILMQLRTDDQPLIYSVLVNLFEQLLVIVAELEKQFTQIQYSLNVLYTPLLVNHELNDQTLIRLLRIVKNLELLNKEIVVNRDFNRAAGLKNVVDEAKIYPSLHGELNQVEVILLGRGNLPVENCKSFVNGVKAHCLNEFLERERKKLATRRITINFTVTGKQSDAFSNLIPIKELQIPAGRVEAEDLPAALALITSALDRSLTLQFNLLDLMENLVDVEALEEAELLDRVYQLLTNYINLSEYNDAEKHYGNWIINKGRVEELIKNKLRSETNLRTAELPTATTTSTETAAAKSTPSKPTGTPRS